MRIGAIGLQNPLAEAHQGGAIYQKARNLRAILPFYLSTKKHR